MPSKKVFVVIAGRTSESPGLYYEWEDVKTHIQGVKQSSGINIVWKSFDGARRDEDAKKYWYKHNTTPPIIRSDPVGLDDRASSSNSNSNGNTQSRNRSHFREPDRYPDHNRQTRDSRDLRTDSHWDHHDNRV